MDCNNKNSEYHIIVININIHILKFFIIFIS